jgi:hypothetical protein
VPAVVRVSPVDKHFLRGLSGSTPEEAVRNIHVRCRTYAYRSPMEFNSRAYRVNRHSQCESGRPLCPAGLQAVVVSQANGGSLPPAVLRKRLTWTGHVARSGALCHTCSKQELWSQRNSRC